MVGSRVRIGGSRAAAAAGIDPWVSRVRLWLELTGQVEPREPSEAMAIGSALEPWLAEQAAERLGLEVERTPDLELVDPARPWMVGHPDGRLGDGRLVELKTAGLRQAPAWADGDMPVGYVCQVQHYLALAPEADGAVVVVLIGGQSLEARELGRDDELIGLLVEREREFVGLVERREAPAPDGSRSAEEMLRLLYPGQRGRRVDVAEGLVARYREERARLDYAEAQFDRARQELEAALGDAEVGLVDGVPVVRYPRVESHRIDVARLRTEYPEVAAVVTRTLTYRRMTVR